jgi:AraC-like DNA-binding protein
LNRIRKPRPATRAPGDGGAESPVPAGLLERLQERVVEPFARASGQSVVVVPLAPVLGGSPTPDASLLVHPLCRPFAGTDYCAQSRRTHLAELKRTGEIAWHRCQNDRLCAVVPLDWSGACLALCKLVCPDATALDTFQSYAELLELLLEHFVVTEQARETTGTAPPTSDTTGPQPWTIPSDLSQIRSSNPLVSRTIEFIESRLSDPALTVRRVTTELGMSYAYLAHLFAQHIGMRMSRYITIRRIEMAKQRLATTDWQIKRIAFECGYVNADWFSHVFHLVTGQKPCKYRAAVRGPDGATESASL